MKKILVLFLMLVMSVPLIAQSNKNSKTKEIEIPLKDKKLAALHKLAKNAPDVNSRIKAIQELGKRKRSESVQVLIDVLEEPYRNRYAYGDKQMQNNWKVRVAAARTIRAYSGNKEVIRKVYRPLTKVMVFDPEERVKGECALTLGVIGKNAEPAIKERIANELIIKLNHCPVSKNLFALMLVKALGRIGHPKGLVPLISVTQKGYLKIVKEEAKRSIQMLENS